MILDFAVTTGAIVVSNDNFMDLYEVNRENALFVTDEKRCIL